jgi:3-deoxy-manno-octulosonate cytidylyltransferase (CMP-KDO synthetase)
MNELKSIVIIPARFDSSRFPGKPLAKIAGKPMIQHVYERALQARGVDAVIVATDDPRIQEVVNGFGGTASLTSREHRSGTDRVAEAAVSSDAPIIVNLQGDEPLIDPGCIEAVLRPFYSEPELMISTLKSPLVSAEEFTNPNVVKVVTDRCDYALYFSRSPIPHLRGKTIRPNGNLPGCFKHVGIYAYRRSFLALLPTLSESSLEKAEELEQLRFLQNGFRIKVVSYDYQSVAVDTPEDLVRVQAIMEENLGEG